MAWNKPSEPKKVEIKGGGGQRKVYLKGILVGAVAVVVGVVCIFAFSGKSEKPVEKSEKTGGRIKEVTPAPAPKAVEEPKEEPKVDPKLAEIRQKVKGMNKEERADFAFKMMREKPLDLTPTTNKPFRTATELHLARMFTRELGDRPPPPIPKIPIQDEAHLAEILIANNPAIEGDSEEIKLGKEAVELAKKELREYIKEGGDANSFVDYYYGKLNAAYQERTDALKEVMRVAKEDPDIAGEYYRQINQRLEKKGIKKLEIPEKVKAKFGLED